MMQLAFSCKAMQLRIYSPTASKQRHILAVEGCLSSNADMLAMHCASAVLAHATHQCDSTMPLCSLGEVRL